MKILGRILYSLTFALLIFPLINTATNIAASKYFNNEGKDIYLSDSPDRYRLFYGSTGYHLNDATYHFVDNDYQIQFFEINRVFQKDGEITVIEYFYIIIDHPSNILTISNPQKYYLRFMSKGEIVSDLRIHQFEEIPFSVVVDDEDKGLIDAHSIIDNKIDTVQIIDYTHDGPTTILAEYEMEFKVEDLVIKEVVKTYHSDIEHLNANDINIKYQVESQKYNYIIWLFVLGYVIIVGGFTYWLFFKKRNEY